MPEGIVFQSQTAHKQLRKMLVENYLVAVISLPSGVFQPYSGVKTSILILDRVLAKKTDRIGFFKVESDGFDLGAQRRPIDQNDLPQVRSELATYLNRLRVGAAADAMQLAPTMRVSQNEVQYTTNEPRPTEGLIAEKEKIAANGEYNLSRERYREDTRVVAAFPFFPIGEICTINPRKSELSEFPSDTKVSFVPMADLNENQIAFVAKEHRTLGEVGASYTYFADNDVLLSKVTPCFENGKAGIARNLKNGIGFGSSEIYVLRSSERVLPEWIYFCVTHPLFRQPGINNMTGTGGLQRVPRKFIDEFEIPLPPLEVQQEIVTEIEGYQKIIDGARGVIDNYHPEIPIDPSWPLLTLSKAPFEIIDGDRGVNYPKKEDFSSDGYCVFLNTKNVRSDGFNFNKVEFITRAKDAALRKGRLRRGDVVLTTRGTIGNTGYYDDSIPFERVRINSGMLIFRPDENKLSGSYLFQFFRSKNFKEQRKAIVSGAAQPQLPVHSLNEARLPLPDLETQQAIVAEIDTEEALVAANHELVERFERKIQQAIARVWED